MMEFLGKNHKKIIGVVIIVLLVAASVKIWTNYFRRNLDLTMDMCDLDGNVIHVTVYGVLRRGWGEPWKFEGEIHYDGKIFTYWEYKDGLVPHDFKVAGNVMANPDEWINSFEVKDRADGTYYFMPYQRKGAGHREGSNAYIWQEGDSIDYFGPASTKEEAERICNMWVHSSEGE